MTTTTVGIPVNGVELLKEVGAAVFADPDMVGAVERDGQLERRALVQVQLLNGSIVIRGDPALVERARDAARAVIEKRQGHSGSRN